MIARPRVFICARVAPSSPGLPTIPDQILAEYAGDAMRHAIDQGAAPFPWLGYDFLDYDKPEDHAAARSCCLSWVAVADELWIYEDLGVSESMKGEIAFAKTRGIPIKHWRLFPI